MTPAQINETFAREVVQDLDARLADLVKGLSPDEAQRVRRATARLTELAALIAAPPGGRDGPDTLARIGRYQDEAASALNTIQLAAAKSGLDGVTISRQLVQSILMRAGEYAINAALAAIVL